MSGEALLVLRDAVLHPGGRTRIRGVNAVVRPGEIVAISGASGGGKTSLLRAAAGLVPVESGVIERRTERVAVMFQDPRLLPWRTVLENVLFVVGRPPGPEHRAKALYLLDRLGVAEVRDERPASLSGGMRRRVSLARALLPGADLLLADEPFAHLDEGWADAVALLITEQAEAGVGVLLAAHEIDLVSTFADRVQDLHGGRIDRRDSRRGPITSGGPGHPPPGGQDPAPAPAPRCAHRRL